MTEDMKVQDYLKYYGNLEDFFDLELIKLSHFKKIKMNSLLSYALVKNVALWLAYWGLH